METLHEIIIGLLTNVIWALGGFLIAYLIKKATDSHGRGNETIVTCAIIKKTFVIVASATGERNNFLT